MGRRRQPDIRDKLLEACVDHALSHGLPHRLEPFVAATGTSARMLLYHFHTRDGLRTAVLRRARERQLADWSALLSPRANEPYTITLQRAWTEMAGPGGLPYRAMFGQRHADEPHKLLPALGVSTTTDWFGPLEAGLQDIGRPHLATLALAVFRGLFLDLDATADVTRTDRAFADFIALLDRGI